MNKQRRKVLAEVVAKIDEAMELLESVQGEEQEAFDNMPEGIQVSERGETMEEYISTMEEQLSYLEDAKMELEDML